MKLSDVSRFQHRRRAAVGRVLVVILCVLGAGLLRAGDKGEEPEPPKNPAFKRPDFGKYYEGRYVFERYCIVCHGPDGDGKGEMSPQLPVKPRSFLQGFFKYRSTPPGKLPTDDDLRRTVTGGITGTAMGMFTMLTAQEVEAVIEYVKFFSRRWRKQENFALPLEFPPVPKWMETAADRAKHADAGKVTFNNTCAACHGTAGDGKGPAAGQLQDMWGFKVQPADLRQPHLRCGDDWKDVYRTLTTGLDGTPMVSFAEVLTPEQRWDVVAYVASLRQAGVK